MNYILLILSIYKKHFVLPMEKCVGLSDEMMKRQFYWNLRGMGK